MTQFPLGDNLRDARQARDEGYAGTINDTRLVWFLPSRRLTVPAVALAALASLIALSALAMPVVGLAPGAAHTGRANLLSATLGYHYGGVWLALGLVLAAGASAAAASSFSGGPASQRHGNLFLVAACALFGLAAIAAAAYLLTHSQDLALRVFERSGPGVLTKGREAWQAAPWPYLARPGAALWASFAAAVIGLSPCVLLTVNALSGRAHVTTTRHLTRASSSPARKVG